MSVVAPFSYSSLIWATLYGYIIFSGLHDVVTLGSKGDPTNRYLCLTKSGRMEFLVNLRIHTIYGCY